MTAPEAPMEPSEARERLKAMSSTHRLDAEEDYISAPGSTEAADAIDTILAALDAATAEAQQQRERAERAEGDLAQALERWPGDGSPGDEIGMVNGKYCVIVPDVRLHESEVKRFTSRIDAARCAAGLPAKEAADAATPE